MRNTAWVVLVLMGLSIAGCAQKSDSEKALDAFKKDANKAMNKVEKDVNNL